MKKLASLVLLVLLVTILSPVLESFHVEKKYSYASEESMQSLHFENIPDKSASLGIVKSSNLWKQAQGKISFASERNMFTLRLPMTFSPENQEDTIHITLSVQGKKIPVSIDEDGDGRTNGYYYTEPVFLGATKEISYLIETKNTVTLPTFSIIGLDTDEGTSHIVFGLPQTNAEGSPKIITRAEWGADESIRYRDSPTWTKVFAKIEANKDLPKSDATLQYNAHVNAIQQHLTANFPDQDEAVDAIKIENGHELTWYVEKTKKVERIVLHHTAENNEVDKDNLSYMRGIYYFHTVVRGWGDIGYNYVIGQRGAIYEGRDGGDYAVGAHALWNNKSSVGISIMGDFTKDSIVSEQEDSIKNMIEYLSKKYGIDIHKTSIGHRECKKEGCVLDDFETPNLAGHRDMGFTSCPGNNILALIEKIRTTETASIGRTPILNPNYSSIQIASNSSSIAALLPKPLNKGPLVRIRLSYTGSTIRLKSGDTALPRLVLGNSSGSLKKNFELSFAPSGSEKIALVVGRKKYTFSRVEFSGNLVVISSWNRKPSWDQTGLLNDNVFRGNIILLNEGGKLVVVNELPLEDYLRGIAEVSNTDNEEKIKTILVAARSYAYFYSFPENRKFPGKSYDGSDNPDEFQKYLGYGYERRSPISARLVDATNGKIITYDGKPIKPWYFSESSGRTLSYKEYCENRKTSASLPVNTVCADTLYLQSVSDPGGVGHTQQGHGVGISGIGATYLATNMEMNYEQIIGYYLTGVKVEKKY